MNSLNTPKPTKEGELQKYKNMWLGWGTRYFKLERMYLHYFESKDAPTSINTVTRGDISDVKESHAFPDRTNVFEIHTKSGLLWYLQTTSPQEMMLWMKALKPDHEFDSYPLQTPAEPSAPPPPLGLEPNQGPYIGPQPHLYPNLYSPGQPLHDPNVHGCGAQYSPPPSYEESSQAAPLPEKSR